MSGRLVLPGLVDAHCHLDKTLYGGPWVPHSAGDALEDRIANDRRRRGELGIPSVDRIVALLEQMVAAGTSHVRSHTDVDPEVGLRGVEAVRAAAQRLDGRIGVEQVAFPQHGLLTNPGTAELLEEALKRGVETIGGIDPAGVDRDPVRHLDIVFDLAARYGARIDLHLHDGGSLGMWELELIVDRTRDAGLGGRVTISHAYGFSQADPAVAGADVRAARRGRGDAADGRRLQLPGPADQAAARRRRQRGVRARRDLRPVGPVRQRRHARARDARGLPQHVPPRRGHRARVSRRRPTAARGHSGWSPTASCRVRLPTCWWYRRRPRPRRSSGTRSGSSCSSEAAWSPATGTSSSRGSGAGVRRRAT